MSFFPGLTPYCNFTELGCACARVCVSHMYSRGWDGGPVVKLEGVN